MKRRGYRPKGFFQLRHRLTVLLADIRGASAVEFALLAPVLILALLGTVDVGRALTDQMGLGSRLRTGAQAAMAGGGRARIEQVLHAETDDATAVEVARVCACPENAEVAVDCSTTCAGPAPTAIYYHMVARKTFSGIFLPDLSLSRSLQVQVR